jgi:hypothetical protein
MSEQGWRKFLATDGVEDSVVRHGAAADGRVVDESHIAMRWTRSDRAGNRVCTCAWPGGSATLGRAEDV